MDKNNQVETEDSELLDQQTEEAQKTYTKLRHNMKIRMGQEVFRVIRIGKNVTLKYIRDL